MECKPDWEACKQRYRAWWANEDFGRAGIFITAPKQRSSGLACPPYPEKIEDRWIDRDFICKRMDYELNQTYYGGEAFPIWHAGYPGWDALPTFLGCDVKLDEITGWWMPIIEENKLSSYNPAHISINRENKWYKMSEEFRQMAIRESKGRAIPATGAFGGCGDTLAALRSTEQLLFDLKEEPETVLAFELRMMEIWCGHYDERYADLKTANVGTSGWFPLWSPGKFYAGQCDFSYMISPKDFERCFLPVLDKQTRFLDYTIYHVDGIESFRHVGSLCSLPKLQALQILPGEGKPGPLHYLNVLRKVQKAGKNLHITIAPAQVKDALELLSSRGLMIETWANSEDEANDIIRYVEKNSAVRV